MALAFVSLRPVIGLGPRAELAAAIAPQMNGVAQVAVAMPADFGFADLAALKTHRSGPRHALQPLGLGILAAIGADLRQQPRRQLVARSGQAAEQIMIGMLREEFFNLGPIGVELTLEWAQEFDQANGKPALGPRH